MKYVRMPIEVEAPEEYRYSCIRHYLSESSIARNRGRKGLKLGEL